VNEESDESLTVFDLLERTLAGTIQGYAIVFKDIDGSMNFRHSDPCPECSYYEILGMVTQLKDDLLMRAREQREEI
jgi:hypothetical protein